MILYIAEKPSLGQAIADALPGGAIYNNNTIIKGDAVIIWCYGHLLTLKDPEDIDSKYRKWKIEDLPIYFTNWEKKIISDKLDRVKQIGLLLQKADVVVNCGDIDEEGQLLVDELIQWFSYKGIVKRLDTSNTNKNALVKALNNMKDNKLFEKDGWSAYGRMLADKIFGYNFSRYYTVKNNCYPPLTVGRVQTPALGLVVNRDRVIEGHKKLMYYELFSNIVFENYLLEMKYIPDENNTSLVDGKFLDKNYLVDKECNLQNKKLDQIIVKKEYISTSPPLPFNLTKLNTYCGKKWNMKPDKVMSITQSLRDNYKAITYNRSDCQYLSMEHFKEAPETIKAACMNLKIESLKYDTTIRSKCFNDNNITAHFAIIPTNERFDINKLKDEEKKVYKAICDYYLIQFMPCVEKEKTIVEAVLDNKEFLRTTGSKIKSPGYLIYLNESMEEDDEDYIKVCNIPEGVYLGKVLNTCIKEKETKPPSRYTQNTLYEDLTRIAKYVDDPEIKTLLLSKDKNKDGENGSIGTSATRAEIIKNLIKREFLVERKEGKREVLVSTEKGREFYDMLPDNIKKADITAKWWVIQEDIKLGKSTPITLAESVKQTVIEVIENGNDTSISNLTIKKESNSICKCPKCGGDILEGEKGYYCSNYKQGCKIEGLWKKACWVHITRTDAKNLLLGKKIVKTAKSKSGSSYKKSLVYNISEGKITEV